MGKEDDLLEDAKNGNISRLDKVLSLNRSGPLSRKRPNVNYQQLKTGYTALHLAALHGHREAIELLLKCDASCNIRDVNGCIPLHMSAWCGTADILRVLLCRGPSYSSIDHINDGGDTALHYACQHGNKMAVVILLENKAAVFVRNKKGASPLDLAAQFGRLEVVEVLIKNHPRLLDWSSNLQCPLHLASVNGHKRVVECLLRGGYDINKTTDNGTALHDAALFGKIAVVRLLLDCGIDVCRLDNAGKTAYDCMSDQPSKKSKEIAALIHEYMQRGDGGTPPPSLSDQPMPAVRPRPNYKVVSPPSLEGPCEYELLDFTEQPRQKPLIPSTGVYYTIENVLSDVPLPTVLPSPPMTPPRGWDDPSDCYHHRPRSKPMPAKPPRSLSSQTSKSSTVSSSDRGSPTELTGDDLFTAGTRAASSPYETIHLSGAPVVSADCDIISNYKQLPPPLVVHSRNMFSRSASNVSNNSSDGLGPIYETIAPPVREDSYMMSHSCSPLPPSPHTAMVGISNKLSQECLTEDVASVPYIQPTSLSPCLHSVPSNQPSPYTNMSGVTKSAFSRLDSIRSSRRQQREPQLLLDLTPSPSSVAATTMSTPETVSSGNNPDSARSPLPGSESSLRARSNISTLSSEFDETSEWAQIDDILASLETGLDMRWSTIGSSTNDDSPTSPPITPPSADTTGVSHWLDSIGLGQYEALLVSNGFDDVKYMALLDDMDLLQIGVLSESDRQTIQSAALRCPPVESLAEMTHPPQTVSHWLSTLSLSEYAGSFSEGGFNTIDDILRIWEVELENLLGVSALGHRKRVLASIRPLQGTRGGADGNNWVVSKATTLTESGTSPPMDFNSESDQLQVKAEIILKELVLLSDLMSEPLILTPPGHSEPDCQRPQKKPLTYSTPVAPALEKVKLFKDYTAHLSQPSKKDPSPPSLPHAASVGPRPTVPERSPNTRGLYTLPARNARTPVAAANTSATLDSRQKNKKWKHDPETLISGCCNYSANYLGTMYVAEMKGTESTKEACTKMKKSLATQKIPQIQLSISVKGVNCIDATSKQSVCEHHIHNITCASQDDHDLSIFAYITKDQILNKFYCHVFKVKSATLGREIVNAIGQAFDLAYNIFKKDRPTPDKDPSTEPDTTSLPRVRVNTDPPPRVRANTDSPPRVRVNTDSLPRVRVNTAASTEGHQNPGGHRHAPTQ